MSVTSPDSIFYPDTSYVDGWRDADEAQANTIQTALTNRGQYRYRWTNAAARTAQTGMRVDDYGYQIDTGITYRYSGSAWLTYMTGQFVIYPTSVANATVGADGQLSVSAASSFSANGCFTSLYDTYRISLNLQLSANTEMTVRLRLAGADISTANYNDVRVYSTTTSAISQALAATAFRLSIAPGGTSGWLQGEVRFIAPALTSATGYNSDVSSAVGNTAMAQSRVTGHHSLSTAYDGFSVIATSGTITGTATILGCP